MGGPAPPGGPRRTAPYGPKFVCPVDNKPREARTRAQRTARREGKGPGRGTGAGSAHYGVHVPYCAHGGWRAGKAGRDRRSACSVAVESDLWTLKLSPRWAGGCGATACVSVLPGKPKRGGWCGDATSGLLGGRSALFKHALHAVIVRGVAGAQWGERGAAMGYGLTALGSRLSAPWRLGALVTRGRGVFVFWIACL